MDVFFDTNVISELFRTRPARPVVKFIRRCEKPWISVAVFHELTFGLERLADSARRTRLGLFLDQLRGQFRGRTVDVDLAIAESAGAMRGTAVRQGWVLSEMDSLIAATAAARSAQLATRNTRDFERLGIPLIDPWRT
jgi:toxin FitB